MARIITLGFVAILALVIVHKASTMMDGVNTLRTAQIDRALGTADR